MDNEEQDTIPAKYTNHNKFVLYTSFNGLKLGILEF